MAKRQDKKTNGNGANLGFEQTLWLAADKLRNNLDAAEYKHVVLGLIFLKYISDAFAEVYAKLAADTGRRGRRGRPRRIPRGGRLLGAAGGPLGLLAGEGQAAQHRQAGRCGDGRHRTRQPEPQGRVAQAVRPAGARQAAARRTDRPDRHHRPGRPREPLERHLGPGVRILPLPIRQCRR